MPSQGYIALTCFGILAISLLDNVFGSSRPAKGDAVKVANNGSGLICSGLRSVASVYDAANKEASVKGTTAFSAIVDVTPSQVASNHKITFRFVQLIYGTWDVYNADGSGHGQGQSTNGVYMLDHIDTDHWSSSGNEFTYSFGDTAGPSMGLHHTPPTNAADVSFYFLDYVQYSVDGGTWHTCLKGSWHVTGSGSLTSTGGGTSVLDHDLAPSTEQPDLSGGQYIFGSAPAPYNF